jgi:hypothetical protein
MTVTSVKFPEYLINPIICIIMRGMYEMKVAPEKTLYTTYVQRLEYTLSGGNIPLTFNRIRSGLKEFSLDKMSLCSFADADNAEIILGSWLVSCVLRGIKFLASFL